MTVAIVIEELKKSPVPRAGHRNINIIKGIPSKLAIIYLCLLVTIFFLKKKSFLLHRVFDPCLFEYLLTGQVLNIIIVGFHEIKKFSKN